MPRVFSITSITAIEMLTRLFAPYGLPEEMVSDNGPQFISKEIEQVTNQNEVQHTRVPSYHPASNGKAERCVKALKQALMTSSLDKGFLSSYRNTPHTVTGQSPANLFLKRKHRN